ncbi:MAG: C39 family peptidase [Chloroflexota bacterium]
MGVLTYRVARRRALVLTAGLALTPLLGRAEALGQESVPRLPIASGPIDAAAFRLEVPFRTQKDGSRWQSSNCGPATLGMILDGLGIVGQSTEDLRTQAHTYQGTLGMRTGTALEHIAHVAEDYGVRTDGLFTMDGRFRTWGMEDVHRQLRLGRPVMPLVRLYLVPGYEGMATRWGHYVLLTGVSDKGFFFSDSLKTDPVAGVNGYITEDQLGRAMDASHIPGQALAFGGVARSG